MEPSEEVTAKDIYEAVSVLLTWNSKSFQHFLESGVLHDARQAISLNKSGTIGFKARDMIIPPRRCGDVSWDQALKFLSEVPKAECREFLSCIRKWCKTSGWWEDHSVTWELRDEWRAEMGLVRKNHVISVGPLRVVFKELGGGKNPVWEEAPHGYRFATVEEIKITGVHADYNASTLVKTRTGWSLANGTGELPVMQTFAESCMRDGTYHHHGKWLDVVIPIVKM